MNNESFRSQTSFEQSSLIGSGAHMLALKGDTQSTPLDFSQSETGDILTFTSGSDASLLFGSESRGNIGPIVSQPLHVRGRTQRVSDPLEMSGSAKSSSSSRARGENALRSSAQWAGLGLEDVYIENDGSDSDSDVHVVEVRVPSTMTRRRRQIAVTFHGVPEDTKKQSGTGLLGGFSNISWPLRPSKQAEAPPPPRGAMSAGNTPNYLPSRTPPPGQSQDGCRLPAMPPPHQKYARPMVMRVPVRQPSFSSSEESATQRDRAISPPKPQQPVLQPLPVKERTSPVKPPSPLAAFLKPHSEAQAEATVVKKLSAPRLQPLSATEVEEHTKDPSPPNSAVPSPLLPPPQPVQLLKDGSKIKKRAHSAPKLEMHRKQTTHALTPLSNVEVVSKAHIPFPPPLSKAAESKLFPLNRAGKEKAESRKASPKPPPVPKPVSTVPRPFPSTPSQEQQKATATDEPSAAVPTPAKPRAPSPAVSASSSSTVPASVRYQSELYNPPWLVKPLHNEEVEHRKEPEEEKPSAFEGSRLAQSITRRSRSSTKGKTDAAATKARDSTVRPRQPSQEPPQRAPEETTTITESTIRRRARLGLIR